MGWHDLRHTYGSHWAMKGAALKVFQELMGHATLEMTTRYATSALRRCGTQQLRDTPCWRGGLQGQRQVG